MTHFHEQLEHAHLEIEERANAESAVCRTCITDAHLWAAVEELAEDGACSFCEIPGRCVTFENLAEPIEEALNSLYLTVAESGAFHEEGHWNVPTHDVGNILENELLYDAVDDQVVLSLIAYVGGRNAVDYGYVERLEVWASLYGFDEGSWRQFIRTARDGQIETATEDLLKHLPQDTLDLFVRIERYARTEGLYKTAVPALWRGRPCKSGEKFYTGRDIGSSPNPSSGRLNAVGQSVFYGATEIQGAVIEMANHHGKDVELSCGKFTPTRSLYHLDIMTVPDHPSPFAPGAADTYDVIKFLIRFAETTREPKPPRHDGEIDNDYWARLDRHFLPTQIFTAFLLGAHEDLRPDAIKYGSSLDPTSENWVVFADNDHCVDADDTNLPADGVCMLLDTSTVVYIRASAYLPKDPDKAGL